MEWKSWRVLKATQEVELGIAREVGLKIACKAGIADRDMRPAWWWFFLLTVERLLILRAKSLDYLIKSSLRVPNLKSLLTEVLSIINHILNSCDLCIARHFRENQIRSLNSALTHILTLDHKLEYKCVSPERNKVDSFVSLITTSLSFFQKSNSLHRIFNFNLSSSIYKYYSILSATAHLPLLIFLFFKF